jgi:hypothetical protein
MLGIGLMLFCLRGLTEHKIWNENMAEDILLVFQHRTRNDAANVIIASRYLANN